MHENSPNPHNAMSAAVAAWNYKAKETSAPVLRHIFSSIRALQRLRAALRHYGELEPSTLTRAENPDATTPEPVQVLRSLCARLDHFEQDLAKFQVQALAVGEQGESLIADYLAFLNRGAAPSEATESFQLHLANWAEDGVERRRESDMRALDRLIEAQKSEIASLHAQLSEAESSLARQEQPVQTQFPRAFGEIELQSIQEFVQNSPIASVPVNASYYERILEAASAPETQKVPMGEILTIAGVVTERQLENALDYQRQGRKQALGNLLVDLGYTTEDAIAQALAAQLGLPYVVLTEESIDANIVTAVPHHIARRHACLPLSFHGHSLSVAMANPLDLIALEDLRIASNRHIRPCVAARGEILGQIERYYASTP